MRAKRPGPSAETPEVAAPQDSLSLLAVKRQSLRPDFDIQELPKLQFMEECRCQPVAEFVLRRIDR